jgi:hypothetical protein
MFTGCVVSWAMAIDPTVISLAAPFGVGSEIVVALGFSAVVFVGTLTLGLVATRGRRRSTSRCRWKRDGLRPETRLRRWACTACCVEAYTLGRRSPRECKRASRPLGL